MANEQILSALITGSSHKEFTEKLNKFLERDVVINSTQFSTCAIPTKKEGKLVLNSIHYSCLIFYSMRR